MDQFFYLFDQVRQVPLNLHIILGEAGRLQEMIVVLDESWFECDDHGLARLRVLQRSGAFNVYDEHVVAQVFYAANVVFGSVTLDSLPLFASRCIC